jgi:hypothetical protein
MRLLIDTNVILEVLLLQEKESEAKSLLTKIEEYEFFLSDYSLHSIGMILLKRRQTIKFAEFCDDMLVKAGMQIAYLLPEEMKKVIRAAQQFNLDFDDAYQYVIAEKLDLTLVSLDSDFDRTERKRKTPAELIA